MTFEDCTRTSPTLLGRTSDWNDQAAWREFVGRYDPLIRGWCREYRLDDEFAADVVQSFWIELAEKMHSFRYDPSRRFRGWLRICFHWRVADAIRQVRREGVHIRSLDDPSAFDVGWVPPAPGARDREDDESTTRRLRLLELAAEVQDSVRHRVHAQSWQVFWHISIDGWTTRETADALNMTYLAAHAANKRVVDRLAAEGNRRLADLMGSDAAEGTSRS